MVLLWNRISAWSLLLTVSKDYQQIGEETDSIKTYPQDEYLGLLSVTNTPEFAIEEIGLPERGDTISCRERRINMVHRKLMEFVMNPVVKNYLSAVTRDSLEQVNNIRKKMGAQPSTDAHSSIVTHRINHFQMPLWPPKRSLGQSSYANCSDSYHSEGSGIFMRSLITFLSIVKLPELR